MKADLGARLTDWQGLLQRQPVQARQILRKLLVGRLVFAPKSDESGRYYEFSGQATMQKLLGGVIDTKALVSPTGFVRWWHNRWSLESEHSQ